MSGNGWRENRLFKFLQSQGFSPVNVKKNYRTGNYKVIAVFGERVYAFEISPEFARSQNKHPDWESFREQVKKAAKKAREREKADKPRQQMG